jgi:Ca2+-binding EF-hand superfamily protein
MLSTSQVSEGTVERFFNYCIEVAFNTIDTNRDGAISFQELTSSLRAAGFPDQDIQTIFALADHDRDGEVSLNELVKALRR